MEKNNLTEDQQQSIQKFRDIADGFNRVADAMESGTEEELEIAFGRMMVLFVKNDMFKMNG